MMASELAAKLTRLVGNFGDYPVTAGDGDGESVLLYDALQKYVISLPPGNIPR
jgi:hypothetical protein